MKGVVLWQPPMHPYSSDPYSTAMYIAMPEKDAALQDYLVATFKRARDASQRICPETGW